MSVGDQFTWLYPSTAELGLNGADPLNMSESAVSLLGFETLRAVKQACEEAGCTQEDVEDIMYNNGMRLFAAKTREFCAAHPTPLEIVMPGQREKM